MAGPDQLSIYQMADRLLGEARLALITDDIESRYALDDAWPRAVAFVLAQAAWRFALKSAALIAGGAAAPGYAKAYALPTDWFRTHAIFLSTSDGREHPIDLREQGAVISVNVAAVPVIRFVSSAFIDPTFAAWPERFAQCVAAYLAFLVAERVTGERSAPGRMSQVFSNFLPEAIRIEAVDEDIWLPHQRDGTFLRVASTMTNDAFWRFAMVTVNINTVTGLGQGGFTNAFTIPADWSQTRSLYLIAPDGSRRPFDVREHGAQWHANTTGFYAEYVSQTLAMDATKWPDQYKRGVLRQIQFDRANRGDSLQSPPTYGRDYELRTQQAWKEALADTIASEADAPDPWLPYQRNGSYIRAARAVISRGYWWWALKEVDLSTQAASEASAGFPYRFRLPDDWLRTHTLFVPWDGAECPFNIRESAEDWSTDAPFFTARYVTTAALDATTWPEVVAQAVLAYLDMQSEPEAADPKEAQAEQAEAQTHAAIYQKLLGDALELYSRPEDPWLRFQLNGRYIQGAKLVLEKARWKFAIKTVLLQTDDDPNNASFVLRGAATPGDTLTLTVTNQAVTGGLAAVSYTVRTNDTLSLVAAHLAQQINASPAIQAAGISASSTNAEVDTTLSRSLTTLPSAGLVQPPAVQWAASTSSGASETITIGTVIGTPASQGYSFRLPKPLDWIRTLRVWYSLSDGIRPLWYDIDFRDEGGALHANYAPLGLRYLSRIGLDATIWPSNFRDAVLAWLEHVEARGDVKLAAVAKARLQFFEEQCERAETLDDENEVPQQLTSGRFVRGRYGRGTLNLEQGLPPFTPL